MNNIACILLAAGKGTRLNNGSPSPKPKVLFRICDKPIISYSISTLKKIKLKDIVIVIGYLGDDVKKELGEDYEYVNQNEQLGTGHAVKMGLEKIQDHIDTVLVLNGDDSAFYHSATIKNLIKMQTKNGAKISLLTLRMRNPKEYGRIKRDEDGDVVGIVEARDASPEELKIKEINTGTYCFDANWLRENITKLKLHEDKNEYYITDLVKMAEDQGEKITSYRLKSRNEWVGINDTEQLEYANKAMAERLLKKASKS